MTYSGKQAFKVLLLWILLVSTLKVNAQQKLYSKALKALAHSDTVRSIKLCQQGIEKYPNYADFYLLNAKIFYQQHNFINAVPLLKQYFRLTKDSLAINEIAYAFFYAEYYDSAAFYFRKFLKLKPDAQKPLYMYNLSLFRAQAYKNPINWQFNPLPKQINTYYAEYFPAITADNQLFFTRKASNEDIFTSKLYASHWSSAISLPNIINTPEQEGACTISPDGKTMIFTRCIMRQGCDLYISKFINGNWTEPHRLPPPVNSRFWESQPCLANNGKTLLFASNRPGGYGKSDIWAVEWIDGKWQNLYNLGDSINTPGDEMTPCLHFDGKTLYFASNYHYGLGGLDIFVAKFKNNHWSTPKNLGYPLNTKYDETKFVVSVSGDSAYFSKMGQNLDIFSLPMPQIFRPQPTIYVRIKIIDGLTLKPLITQVTIIELSSDSTLYTASDSSFVITLAQGNYALFSEKKGYLWQSINFSTFDTNLSATQELTIKMFPIQVGQSIILHNIFFEFNSYKLKRQSYTELQKLVRFLKDNPKTEIEIIGHTDSIGNDVFNKNLSYKRAEQVKNYLTAKGIAPDRLTVKGCGSKCPIADNKTPQGRKLNRRVEIKIKKL